MTIRRRVWIPLAIAVVAACFIVAGVMRSTVPASTAEIAEAIRQANPACRSLLKERLRAYVVDKGAMSLRTLDTISHLECKVAGPQYEAAGG